MERVIEIVNYLMKQVYIHGDNVSTEKELVDSLVQLGYSTTEIDVAFKLLYSFPHSVKSEKEEEVGEIVDLREGVRILSPDEQKKLSVACQGEIIRLISNSLLTLPELERILSEATHVENGEIGLKELGTIIHKVIIDQERLLMIAPPHLNMVTQLLYLISLN